MEGDVLRTQDTLLRYKARRQKMGNRISKVDLLTLPKTQVWEHWVLVENEFPYDQIAQKHNILVPKRWFVDEHEINKEEREELAIIKDFFAKNFQFDCIIENIKHNRTVPNQFHLHCIKYHHVTPIKDLS